MLDLTLLSRAKEWGIGHRKDIALLAGVLLTGTLAFESGVLRGSLEQSEPLVISLPAPTERDPAVLSETAETGAKTGGGTVAGVAQAVALAGKPSGDAACPFVGSRNSNKYHLSTCAVAKRIKPENRVCFASQEEAQKRGYVASCIK
ncbi:MAG: hypothetical protein A3E38_01275 [Candidatus Moranbacteria bacterium RIFCSPHIGHO2_12_FULL_54_9]|nr:MAG: hypothetical protein A2878_00445 [Candidatus Moranbacteria bacterium RIFCSPHIGHO2_01_FULL_54_31]OGI24876.1 MAG: hypothetical protein A3E38_01275 [Candidatus Moranbacteria bacterium RIFCSPHIGHO2_12_FULL_54_9]